jgi:peptidylprolyl isomerase/FKBP-type peptidyl-prolyl cis-trans isomerase FklB
MRRTLFAVLGLAAVGLVAVSCSPKKQTYALTPDGNAQYLADNKSKPGVVTLADGLQYRVIASGNGLGNTPTSSGDMLTVSFTGSLVDGTVFASTRPGETEQIEAGSVPPGWLEALEKMREGDEWELVMPASLGYGANGSGKVPPNATLIYRLKFVSMRRLDAKPGEDR